MRICFAVVDHVRQLIARHRILLFCLAAVFVIGGVVGCFLPRTTSIYVYFIEYGENYIYIIYSTNVNAFRLIGNRALNNLLFFAFTPVFGLSVVFVPVLFLFIFYRGFILGTTCVIIISGYGISGFFALLAFIPQSLIVSFLLAIVCLKAFECAVGVRRARSFFGMREYLIALGLIFCVSLIAALLEFLIVICVLRPCSFLI